MLFNGGLLLHLQCVLCIVTLWSYASSPHIVCIPDILSCLCWETCGVVGRMGVMEILSLSPFLSRQDERVGE